jgi:hypothetical protein
VGRVHVEEQPKSCRLGDRSGEARSGPLTFEQEYEASFVNFEGRAYYAFGDEHKRKLRDRYDPNQPLIICLDFNVAPGVAVVCQELTLPNGLTGTAVIGEVWIPNNSNTPAVCRKILTDWQPIHTGRVEVYGDATGGAGGTAKTEGSDWEPAANPAERARINAVNTRTKSRDGTIRLMVDPSRAPHVVKDFEGVRTLKGGSGEIDKDADKKLTHVSDAIGYYVHAEFPTTERAAWGTSTHTL